MPSDFRPEYDTDEMGEAGALLELLLGGHRPDWHKDAACKEAPLSVSWFPDKGESPAAALEVCHRCLVVTECQAWAIAQGSNLAGVWGGLTEQDRARMRREQKRVA